MNHCLDVHGEPYTGEPVPDTVPPLPFAHRWENLWADSHAVTFFLQEPLPRWLYIPAPWDPTPRPIDKEEVRRVEVAVTNRLLRNIGEGLASACWWAAIVDGVVGSDRIHAGIVLRLVDYMQSMHCL